MMTVSSVGRPVGPCACPDCGWNDDGDLHVVDVYDDQGPPGPRGRGDWREVRNDDEERGPLSECPVCDCWLDADTVRYLPCRI